MYLIDWQQQWVPSLAFLYRSLSVSHGPFIDGIWERLLDTILWLHIKSKVTKLIRHTYCLIVCKYLCLTVRYSSGSCGPSDFTMFIKICDLSSTDSLVGSALTYSTVALRASWVRIPAWAHFPIPPPSLPLCFRTSLNCPIIIKSIFIYYIYIYIYIY